MLAPVIINKTFFFTRNVVVRYTYRYRYTTEGSTGPNTWPPRKRVPFLEPHHYEVLKVASLERRKTSN